MDCHNVTELLPWLLNGTLGPAERAEVVAHLRGCATCRGELAATGSAFELFDPHPASAQLVAVAFDLELEDRISVEAHLSGCAQCREELELVRSNRSLEALDPVARRPGFTGRLALAAAAAGLLAVGFVAGIVAGRGGWGGGDDDRVARLESTGQALRFELEQREGALEALESRIAALEAPRLNIPVVELFPTSLITRGPDAVTILDGSSPEVALILATELRPPLPELRLDLVSTDGRFGWSMTGLERHATEDFTVLVPVAARPAGEARLELAGLFDGQWRVLETYRLRVSSPPQDRSSLTLDGDPSRTDNAK